MLEGNAKSDYADEKDQAQSDLGDVVRIQHRCNRDPSGRALACSIRQQSDFGILSNLFPDALRAPISRSEAFHLNITNTSNRPVMIYIFSVDATGAISLLYPPRNARESLVPNATLATNLGNPCLTYAFDADAPVGLETIKIIASQNPIEADLLTQSGIKGTNVPVALRSSACSSRRAAIPAGPNRSTAPSRIGLPSISTMSWYPEKL